MCQTIITPVMIQACHPKTVGAVMRIYYTATGSMKFINLHPMT